MTWIQGRVGSIAVWTLTIIGAVTMGLAGLSKFGSHQAAWQSRFESWGYPAWFALVIGGAEVLGALLLLVPPVARWAACGLACIMIGALYTVLTRVTNMGWQAAAAQFVLMTVIASLRFWRAK